MFQSRSFSAWPVARHEKNNNDAQPRKGDTPSFQIKMVSNGNLWNRCVRSESPPNSSTVRTNTCRAQHYVQERLPRCMRKHFPVHPKWGRWTIVMASISFLR